MPDQLKKLFEELRLTKYLKKFQEEEVIYEDLRTLSEADLEDLIPKIIPRRRLLRWLKGESQGLSSSVPVVNHAVKEEARPKYEEAPKYVAVDKPRSRVDHSPVPKNASDVFEVKPLSHTQMVMVQGLVQTPHLNGIYILDNTRQINEKLFYRKRVGKAVLSWQQKPQWKVLKNGDWFTPQEGTGIWYISHDFESDLMVYIASSEECPFIKPRDYDGVIWEWHERKEQWVKAKEAEIAGLQQKVRIVIDNLEAHKDLNGTYEMVFPQRSDGGEPERPKFIQVEPERKGILHWEIRTNFQVLKNKEWIKPEKGVGLWVLSPVDALKDMRMYFGSNEEMPFFKSMDYDGCKWEWIPRKNRFDLLKNLEITRQEKFEREALMVCGIVLNRELNGSYIYDGVTSEGRQVYKKTKGGEAFLFWTHKDKWSVRIKKQWLKPEGGVGIWNLSKKIKGKILSYFASNETRPYERGNDYDQVVWEWNTGTDKWSKVKNFEIKVPSSTGNY